MNGKNGIKNQKYSYKWIDIDGAQDSTYFVKYLEILDSLENIKSFKCRSYELMKIRDGNKILDIGCGLGNDVFKLAKMVGKNGKVIGIDKSTALISNAQQKADSSNLFVEFCVGDVNNLLFSDNTFDGCRADRVFQHLGDRKQALNEMIRVARNGAYIAVMDPDWETLVIDAPNKNLTRKILNQKGPKNRWCGRQIFRLLKEAGLKNIELFTTTIIINDYTSADIVFGLTSTVNTLLAIGDLTESDVNNWLDYLMKANDLGRFFSALTIFGVCGRKIK